jgi:transcriptional regulator with XRE-family HTH domain
MQASRWLVDGPALTARRIARGMKAAELARRANISVRTLGRYERTPGKLADIEDLRSLARVLHVAVEAIGHPATPPPPAVPAPLAASGAPSPYAAPPERARLLATTQLESIVALESRLPPPKPVAYDGATVPVLTARKLQNVFSAFATYEGERFAMVGSIAKQRGASPHEAQMIGSRHGVAVRFLLVREITDGVDIKVTVHTANAKETRSLQKAFEEERETCAVVRVTLAPQDSTQQDKGFDFFLSPKPLPWGLVVEAVV